MKLGAIKVAVARLMYPDEVLLLDESDEESLNASLYELSCNPNLQGILDACAASVNRCLAYLEGRGVGENACVHFQGSACPKNEAGEAILSLPSDVSLVQSVILRRGAEVIYPEYRVCGGKVIAKPYTGVYTVVYLPKHGRVTSLSDNCLEVYLPFGLDEQIPYYVVSDLTAQENPTLSRWSREAFDGAVSYAEKNGTPPCQGCVFSVYGDD